VLLESCLLALLGGTLGLGLAWLATSRGDPTGMLPLFYFPHRDLILDWVQPGAGSGHRGLPGLAGDAPAGGGCPKEDVTWLAPSTGFPKSPR